MAYKKQHATYPHKKQYLWRAADFGNGVSLWMYVTSDAVAAVAMYDYFTQPGDKELSGSGAGGEGDDVKTSTEAVGIFKTGDLVWVYQVAGIDDEREIQQDIAAGLADCSLHVVLNSLAGTVNLSEDLLAATVTYTS